MEDQKLVHKFLKSRSEAAFSDLYRAKSPHLYKMALRLTQDQYQAEELLQEMWIIAIRKLPTFAWRSELKTWLCAILLNLFRAEVRKKGEVLFSLAEITDPVVEPDKSYGNTTDLEQAIARLPPGYRQIIVLHDIEGYKHKEIAELLEITEGTSKSQLFHARKALREYLSEDLS